MSGQRVFLVRHGETAWSRDHRHTGRTDVPLTERGREQAAALGALLAGRKFARVLVSPLQRAAETCRIAGYGALAERCDDLREWDYGPYEGRRTADIREDEPGWSIWTSAVPGGEVLTDVAARARRVVAEIRATPGDVLIFAHGHLLRILAACWSDLPPAAGRRLKLDTATLSVLGYEHELGAIERWNSA